MEENKKFKVGDNVRRLNDEHGSMSVGDESIVIGYFDCGTVKLKSDSLKFPKYGHDENNLELVINKK